MNVAQLLVRCLENEGVRYVFGIPGEETLALNAALDDSERIQFVLTRHEQAAAFMADVYGRLSSFPGVCLATLGPGATNLLTGVADAQLDRAPLVAITGQAGLERAHKESHQYIDVVQMFGPVTKWSTRVSVAEATPEIVRKAFRLARIEKPGATHIELPEDVAAEETDMAPLEVRRTSYPKAQAEALERAARIIDEARTPVILAGNGVTRRHAVGHPSVEALRHFVQRSRIWATHTYMAKGVLDPLGQHSLPPVGLQRPGADLGNVKRLADADVVIAIGYDLVEWAPNLWNPKRDKAVVHVDSTPAELDGHYQPSIEVIGELDESLSALTELVKPRDERSWTMTGSGRTAIVKDRPGPLHPQLVIADLREALGPDDVVVPHERAGAGDGQATWDRDRDRRPGRRPSRRDRGERAPPVRSDLRHGVRQPRLRPARAGVRNRGVRGRERFGPAADPAARARPRRPGARRGPLGPSRERAHRRRDRLRAVSGRADLGRSAYARRRM